MRDNCFRPDGTVVSGAVKKYWIPVSFYDKYHTLCRFESVLGMLSLQSDGGIDVAFLFWSKVWYNL